MLLNAHSSLSLVQRLQNVSLLLLMPPALTAPVLSLLWGGDFHVSLNTTCMLSFAAPAAISALSFCECPAAQSSLDVLNDVAMSSGG